MWGSRSTVKRKTEEKNRKKYKKKKKFRQSEDSLCRFFMHQCTKMITKRTFSVRDSSLSVCICSRGCYRLNLERAASSATTITFGCICKMDAGTCEVTGPQRAS